MTEEEKKRVSEVLSEMRGSSPPSSFSSIGEIGNTPPVLNDAPISSLYSSYR
jgi:hypothetical protein